MIRWGKVSFLYSIILGSKSSEKENKNTGDISNNTQSTVNNLYKWKDELEKKIEEKRLEKDKTETLVDDKTGQRLFKPITNNTDMTRHRNRDVFKYLYSLHSSRSKSRKSKKNRKNEFTVDKDLTPQVFQSFVLHLLGS